MKDTRGKQAVASDVRFTMRYTGENYPSLFAVLKAKVSIMVTQGPDRGHANSSRRSLLAFGVVILLVGAMSLPFALQKSSESSSWDAMLEQSQSDQADLMAAVESGDPARLRKMLAQRSSSLDDPEIPLVVPPAVLWRAISMGNPENVRLLLEVGANPSADFLFGVITGEGGLAEKRVMIDLLLEAGVDPHTRPVLADQIWRAWGPDERKLLEHLGFEYGPREMCMAGDLGSLKKHLRVPIEPSANFVREYFGTTTLLGIALRCGQCEIAQWLLDSGAPFEVGDANQVTALHLAVDGNCLELLDRLVAADCDINAVDSTGATPLDWAMSWHQSERVEAVLELGADPNRVRAVTGEGPLHVAATAYYFSERTKKRDMQEVERIVRALIRAGADPNLLDKVGRTAKEVAGEYGDEFEKLLRPE